MRGTIMIIQCVLFIIMNWAMSLKHKGLVIMSGILILMTLLLCVLFASCTTVKKVVKTTEFQGSAKIVVGVIIIKSIKLKQ